MDASQEAWLVLRTFVALLAVLALAVATIRFGFPWLLRFRGGQRESALRVEDVLVLDRGHRLYVVRWDDDRLLVGSATEGLTLLSSRPATGRAWREPSASGEDTHPPGYARPPEGVS